MGTRNRKRLVAFVVGHEKWGKTYTLRALCGPTARRVTIGGIEFLVRRSSNDDITTQKPNGYIKFINSLSAPLEARDRRESPLRFIAGLWVSHKEALQSHHAPINQNTSLLLGRNVQGEIHVAPKRNLGSHWVVRFTQG